MSQYPRTSVINTINEIGVIPIFYNGNLEISSQISESCVGGGLKLLEFTNRGIHAIEIFSELEKFCASNVSDAILGVGSIIDAGTAASYINLGANFIVGPTTNPEIARLCNKHKITYIPGCLTPTEISQAYELGVEFVKVFPGNSAGGPGFVKDILGPMPYASVIPTGGVDITRKSLARWFEAGVSAVGMGSKLISSDIVQNREWKKLEIRSREVLDLVKSIRSK